MKTMTTFVVLFFLSMVANAENPVKPQYGVPDEACDVMNITGTKSWIKAYSQFSKKKLTKACIALSTTRAETAYFAGVSTSEFRREENYVAMDKRLERAKEVVMYQQSLNKNESPDTDEK